VLRVEWSIWYDSKLRLSTNGKEAVMFGMGDVIAAFSEDHVYRLTGLAKGRLRYWDRTEFFAPSYTDENPRVPFSRIYSFKDIVALRVLEMLRVQNGVPLQHLRKVAESLSELGDDRWTSTTLWVLNKKVIIQPSGDERPREVVSGQYVLGIELKRIVADTERDVRAMQTRSTDAIGRIVKMRGVSRNAWVVSGTRIRVDSIRRLHEDAYTVEQIIAEYPDLTEADVRAALAHDKAAA
jgi:uncharacterized protein (DUF433 family)